MIGNNPARLLFFTMQFFLCFFLLVECHRKSIQPRGLLRVKHPSAFMYHTGSFLAQKIIFYIKYNMRVEITGRSGYFISSSHVCVMEGLHFYLKKYSHSCALLTVFLVYFLPIYTHKHSGFVLSCELCQITSAAAL